MNKAILVVFTILASCFSSNNSLNPEPPLGKDIEIPTGADGEIIHHTFYTLCYNEKHEQANWVAYILSKDELVKNVDRNNIFRIDEKVSTGSATTEDYKKSGYDRGHLAPAGDMSFSEIAMKESFYYSNMSPQVASFNRGIWKKLEEKVREWSEKFDSIAIVTGPVLTDSLPTIGSNKVSVPKYYYKAILDLSAPEYQSIGFIFENKKHSYPIDSFAVCIDSLESLTGFDFFSAIPDSLENILEQQNNYSYWQ